MSAFGYTSCGSLIFGLLPHQQKARCERLAGVWWAREVYDELRDPSEQFEVKVNV